ncbi:hypothetical protein Ancab_010532 [Ancistrocladus abbreviatus]
MEISRGEKEALKDYPTKGVYGAEFRPNMSIVVKSLQSLLKPPASASEAWSLINHGSSALEFCSFAGLWVDSSDSVAGPLPCYSLAAVYLLFEDCLLISWYRGDVAELLCYSPIVVYLRFENSLLALAAVAALCMQREAEFRPNKSIVVKELQRLLNPPMLEV